MKEMSTDSQPFETAVSGLLMLIQFVPSSVYCSCRFFTPWVVVNQSAWNPISL